MSNAGWHWLHLPHALVLPRVTCISLNNRYCTPKFSCQVVNNLLTSHMVYNCGILPIVLSEFSGAARCTMFPCGPSQKFSSYSIQFWSERKLRGRPTQNFSCWYILFLCEGTLWRSPGQLFSCCFIALFDWTNAAFCLRRQNVHHICIFFAVLFLKHIL